MFTNFAKQSRLTFKYGQHNYLNNLSFIEFIKKIFTNRDFKCNDGKIVC